MCRYIFGWCCIAILPLALLSGDGKDAQAEKAKKKRGSFSIGKDTTFVDGPVDADGYIDYEAALNERLRKEITPDTNANVVLCRVFGPRPEGATMAPAFYKWMQMVAPPDEGEYFVSHSTYLSGLKLQSDALEAALKQYEQVMTKPWSAKKFPDVAAWLEKNEKPLALAIEATKRPRYYYPLVAQRKAGKSQGLLTALLPGVQKCRGLGSALIVRAMLRMHEKKIDEAWNDLLAVHRLARLVGRGGTLIEGLVGVALDNIACNADLAFIEAAKLDSKKLKQCLVDLKALPPMPRMADKMNLAERFWFLEFVMMLDRDGVEQLKQVMAKENDATTKLLAKIAFTDIQWDSAMRASNKFYDRLHAAMSLKERSARERAMTLVERDIKVLKGSISNIEDVLARITRAPNHAEAKGKYLGDLMICLLMPAVAKVQTAADRIEQMERNLHVAFALAAYKSDNGSFPMTLEALAPKYLAKAPNDLFSEKALIYRTTEKGYLLYSVGVNGKDDGGRGYDDDPAGDDLVVRMPR